MKYIIEHGNKKLLNDSKIMKISFITNSPIRRNMIANLFGVCVQLLNQIVLVPFYILFWGNELYSDWIVISALSTIFAMSDVGLNNVIQNRFSIKLSEENYEECESLLTNNFILVAITMLFTLFACGVFVRLWDITKVMSLHLLTRHEANFVFIILIAKVFIGMFSGVENAIYRATHNASISVYMDQIGNLIVALTTLICILLKVPVTLLSILICLPQIVLTIFKYFHSKKYYNYKLSLKNVDFYLFKRILLPSLSFMAFPLGNTVVLQGYTLVVNSFLGADSVVLYNTTRTLCNFIKTFINTLQSAVWPEYSIAYGKKDFVLMRNLHRKILKITIVMSSLSGVGLLLLGPIIFKLWTHNSISFSYSLMVVYVFALFIESLWTSSSVALMATNNHTKLGSVYILSSCMCLLLSIIIANSFMSLWMIASSLILLHFIVAFFSLREGLKLTGDSFKKIFQCK